MASTGKRTPVGGAWHPLARPPSRPRSFGPFSRLARAHAMASAGDAVVAIALAGSLFFDISPGAARGKVALYLLFTIAPFAVVAPLVGPLLDRVVGGRRLLVILGAVVRAIVCIIAVGQLKSLLLFPLAFLLLVLSKAYAVSRSSIVPTVVGGEEELVEANAKLGLISALSGVVVAIPALLVRWIFGGAGVMALAAAVFTVTAVLAVAIPSRPIVGAATDPDDGEHLRTAGITLAASAMAFERACVGFLSFHLAFWLRGRGTSPAWFGVVLAASAIGALGGNGLAPQLRQRIREESMLAASLAAIALGGLFATVEEGKLGAVVLTAVVALAASVGRLAFDAIVQRDSEDANRGRAFAQFETRFQLAWVAAAFVPVVLHLPGWVGFLGVGLLGAFALVSYLVGARYVRRHGRVPDTITRRAVGELRRRRAQDAPRAKRSGRRGARPVLRPPLPPPNNRRG